MSGEAARSDRPRGIRHARALATRRRIVKAAYGLFCERGYVSTTMNDIAAAADVAVQTLYFTFGTKGAILGEAIGAAVVGFESWAPPAQEPDDVETLTGALSWYEDFARAPDAHRALALFVKHGSAVLSRVGPLHAAIAAGTSEPEVVAVLALAEERRVESFREVVRTLAAKGRLRSGLDEAHATDILLVLFSAELYQALTAGRGWSQKQAAAFLLDSLARHLLADEPHGSSR